MSGFEAQHPRVGAGTKDGGQFTATARPEADVTLSPPDAPIPRSADRPDADTWQHPQSAARAAAITAYDDEAGWATIGDELTVRYPASHRSAWVDRAREQLAGLRAAGLTGEMTTHPRTDPYGYYGSPESWDGEMVLPSGAKLLVFGGPSDFDRRRQWVKVAGPSGNGWYAEAAQESGRLDQAEVDHAVEEAVRAHALLDGWRRQVAHAGVPSWHALARVENGRSTLRIEPLGPTMPDMLVRFEGEQILEIAVQRRGERPVPVPNETDALVQLGRRIGLLGGRKAGVPARLRSMLQAAARTDEHPDVIWLMANRSRLANADSPHMNEA